MPGVDIYGKGNRIGPLLGIEKHLNPARKFELSTVEPEGLCYVHKLPKVWNRKRGGGESNAELLEARGGNPTDNGFQVSTTTSEYKRAKIRECDMRDDWRMRGLPLPLIIGTRGYKADEEQLQLWHK